MQQVSNSRVAGRCAGAVLLAVIIALAPFVSAAADDVGEDVGEDVVWGVQPSTPDGPDGRTTFEYQAAPGSVISDWVGVTNHGATPATFRVYGADATVDYDSGAFTLIGAGSASADLGAWTSLDGTSSTCDDTNDAAEAACAATIGATVTLEPGARANVPFTITVPHDATPGDHSAGIVAAFASEAGGEGASVRREDRVGARIYLRVDGPLSPGLGITGSVSDYTPSWIPFAPGDAVVHFDVLNAGNTRVTVTPRAHISGPFGIDLGDITLDPVENLVPGAKTRLTAHLDGIPPLLLLFAEVTLTPSAASGVAQGDPLPAPVTAAASTWAVPWTGLLVLIALAGLIIIVRWRRTQRRDRLAAELAEYAESIRAEQDATTLTPRTDPEASHHVLP